MRDSISELKIIKIKLRSTIMPENLGPSMMMTVKKYIEIDREKLVENVVNLSNLLKTDMQFNNLLLFI